MSLARFNLFVQSYIYLLTKAPAGFFRNLEFACLAVFWTWFSWLIRHAVVPGASGWHRLGFVLAAFVVASPVHVQVRRCARNSADPRRSSCHISARTPMILACTRASRTVSSAQLSVAASAVLD